MVAIFLLLFVLSYCFTHTLSLGARDDSIIVTHYLSPAHSKTVGDLTVNSPSTACVCVGCRMWDVGCGEMWGVGSVRCGRCVMWENLRCGVWMDEGYVRRTCGWMRGTCGWMRGTCGWMRGTCGWMRGTCGWMRGTCSWMRVRVGG